MSFMDILRKEEQMTIEEFMKKHLDENDKRLLDEISSALTLWIENNNRLTSAAPTSSRPPRRFLVEMAENGEYYNFYDMMEIIRTMLGILDISRTQPLSQRVNTAIQLNNNSFDLSEQRDLGRIYRFIKTHLNRMTREIVNELKIKFVDEDIAEQPTKKSEEIKAWKEFFVGLSENKSIEGPEQILTKLGKFDGKQLTDIIDLILVIKRRGHRGVDDLVFRGMDPSVSVLLTQSYNGRRGFDILLRYLKDKGLYTLSTIKKPKAIGSDLYDLYAGKERLEGEYRELQRVLDSPNVDDDAAYISDTDDLQKLIILAERKFRDAEKKERNNATGLDEDNEETREMREFYGKVAFYAQMANQNVPNTNIKIPRYPFNDEINLQTIQERYAELADKIRRMMGLDSE